MCDRHQESSFTPKVELEHVTQVLCCAVLLTLGFRSLFFESLPLTCVLISEPQTADSFVFSFSQLVGAVGAKLPTTSERGEGSINQHNPTR